MKKIFLALVLLTSIVFANNVQKNKINNVKHIIQNQDIMANAIDLYIVLYGVAPGSLANIISKNLLDSSFSFPDTVFSIDTTNKTISVSTTISNAVQYQKDYFKNNYNRDKVCSPSVSGNSFISKYNFSNKAVFSNIASSSMTVSPTSPTSPSNGDVWLDSITQLQYFYYNGSWSSLKAKRLWIVRNTSQLPSSASVNDGAIVINTTSTEKYIYNGATWFKINQNIPFNYN